ncbi:hypothetical protein ALP70_102911 [Pseudomonas savastanoi]|uniref:Uncharacterized protein n=1 Tax=Pseudomonas savastanoi TaxID=29438 RepID=A0A3M5B246_PSESS|nr:hypothetical protein ALP70_102911 [Pseudomonas savastanoi]
MCIPGKSSPCDIRPALQPDQNFSKELPVAAASVCSWQATRNKRVQTQRI